MIAKGEKREEYREVKNHWMNIFAGSSMGISKPLIKIKGKYYDPKAVTIRFSNGYRKDRRQMDVSMNGVRIDSGGNPEWGANPETIYIVIELGEVTNKNY